MKTINTFNALHLGDNLVHLHFLRGLAKKYPEIHFTHGAPDQHLSQLAPLAWDLGNLEITSIALTPQGALNAWRGAEGHWYGHPNRNDFADYHLDWFRKLANRMGLDSPFWQRSDLLFDYPALQNKKTEATAKKGGWDFLIINSPPQSGQFSGYDPQAFYNLIGELKKKHDVITTLPSGHPDVFDTYRFGADITSIGRTSQLARCIIAVATGPIWTTFNVWNKDTVKLRVILLDHERIELAPNTVHARSVGEVAPILRERGLL